MAKGSNQKLKMLYLVKIFTEETDEDHGLTMKEIIDRLAACGVSADRKTLYQDFEELALFGFDIVSDRIGRDTLYSLASREFELPELKLLVDAVQGSRFITEKKSNELIGKLERLASRHQARYLQRQVVTGGRIKTMNESIYYLVDDIHSAIAGDAKIRFRYFQWNEKKEQVLRRNGAWYEVSPWALTWDEQNYYMVAFDAAEGMIKHYRVDKMKDLAILEERREGREQFKSFDLPRYSARLFGMFGGEEVKVTLRVQNTMAGVIIDRFGKDLIFIPDGPDHFLVHVDVALSRQFLGWIIALGDGVALTGPPAVLARMREEIARLARQYPEANEKGGS